MHTTLIWNNLYEISGKTGKTKNLQLRLWCLMPLSAIFQLYRGQFYLWRKPEYPEKTTDAK